MAKHFRLVCSALCVAILMAGVWTLDVPPDEWAPARYDGCWDDAFGPDTSMRLRFQVADDDEHYATMIFTLTTASCDSSLDLTADGVTYQQLWEALVEFEDDGEEEDSKNVALHVISATVTPLSEGAVTLWDTACGALTWELGVTTSAYRSDCLRLCLPSRDGTLDGDTWFDMLTWESEDTFYMGTIAEGVFPFPCTPSERPTEANRNLALVRSAVLPDPDGDPVPVPRPSSVPPDGWRPGVYQDCLGSEGVVLAGWESTEYEWNFLDDEDCVLTIQSRPGECGAAVAISDDLFPDQNLWRLRYELSYELLDDNDVIEFGVNVRFEVASASLTPTNEAGADYWATLCPDATFDVGTGTELWESPCLNTCPPRRDGELNRRLYDVMAWRDDWSFSTLASGFACDEPSLVPPVDPVLIFVNVDAADAPVAPSGASGLHCHSCSIALLLCVFMLFTMW